MAKQPICKNCRDELMVSTYARRKRNGKLMWYNIGQFCPKCGNHVTLPLEQIHENMDLNEEEKAEYCNVN